MGCVRGRGGKPLVQDTLETTKKTECDKINLLRISFHFFFNTYRTYSMHIVRASKMPWIQNAIRAYTCMYVYPCVRTRQFPF